MSDVQPLKVGLLVDYTERGGEIDPTVLGHAIVGMWARVMAWWVEDPGRAPRDEVVETLIALHPASRRGRGSALSLATTPEE